MKSRASLMAMLAIAAGTLLGAASGCELIAGVDRNKIDTGGAGGTGGATGGTTGGGGATGGMTTGGTTTGGTGGAPCDPANCPAPSGECKVAYCDDMGACAEKNADDGTPTTMQIDGDCHTRTCQGGVPVADMVVDDNDVKDDMVDCTADACNNGVEEHNAQPANTTCDDNGGKVCDGDKNCVECNVDMDCTVANPVCDPTHVCVPQHCNNAVKDADETDVNCGGNDCGKCADDLGCAVAGDCQSNNCVSLLCVAGTCNDGILNNTQLSETDKDCGGGTCPDCGFNKTCSANTDCKSGDCTATKCAANCTDTEKDQDETDIDCGGAICGKCANTKTCMIAGDCTSGFCNANVCTACANDLQCAGNQYCLGGVCVADLPTGSVCTVGTQCVTGNCVDGTCCGSAACGSCQACNIAGSLGTCSSVTSAADPDSCTGTQSCDALGVCKKVNGQLCPSGMNSECLNNHCVDGYCCDLACAGTCMACDVAGNHGACVNVLANSTDPVTCAGAGQACDGAGACKAAVGAVCVTGADCANGQCVDGYCCSSAACGTCQSCGLAGSFGACTNIPAGGTDSNSSPACVGTGACNGAGVCKAGVGVACPNGNVDCGNGQCVDSVCCSSACGGTCQQCNLAGFLGTCKSSLAGADPANECSVINQGFADCNGAGSCGLGASGTACVPGAIGACVGPVDCPVGGMCP